MVFNPRERRRREQAAGRTDPAECGPEARSRVELLASSARNSADGAGYLLACCHEPSGL
jgi:hypothetical protein